MKWYEQPLPEIEIRYKNSHLLKKQIKSSKESYEVFKEMYDSDTLEYTESAIALFLNRANKTIGWRKISDGGITGCLIDVRVVLSVALKCGATGIILSHNHPSGNLTPSAADLTLTRKLKAAAEVVDISLLDHIIVSNEGYYSLADNGEV